MFTELLEATKSEKHGAFTWTATATDNSPAAGLLVITGKKCHCRYRVEEYPADFGRGFMLFKLDAGSDKTEERYACLIGATTKACECRGFTATGKCKHSAALAELVKAGQL